MMRLATSVETKIPKGWPHFLDHPVEENMNGRRLADRING